MDVIRFSSFIKVIRVISYVRRFIDLCKRQPIPTGDLTAEEMHSAESCLIRNYQMHYYAEEIELLQNSKNLPPTSTIYQLNPFIDSNDHLLKVNSRLDNSNLPHSEIFMVIVPPDFELDRILIEHYHKKNLHAGVMTVLCDIRKNYWLVRGRSRIKKILRQCPTCKIKRLSAPTERWAPLPRERVDVLKIRPFLDYLAVSLVKEVKYMCCS